MQTPKRLITKFPPSSCKYLFLSFKHSQYSHLIALRLTSRPLITQSTALITKLQANGLLSSLCPDVNEICNFFFFDVLLTVHLSIFFLVINQIDAQNLFYNKFISCLYMFRAQCGHRQEVKIVLYSVWYRHTL